MKKVLVVSAVVVASVALMYRFGGTNTRNAMRTGAGMIVDSLGAW